MKIREALKEDVRAIVELLADDPWGAKREIAEDPLPDQYYQAFEEITQDRNNQLLVVVDEKNKVIGTFQLTFIANMTYVGGMRAQIEGVRIHKDHRKIGIGEKVLEWTINLAKQKDCHLIQLSTFKERSNAYNFYEKQGFKATHEGMKLFLK